MKLYKLTNKKNLTRPGYSNETKWHKGKEVSLPVLDNPQLCSDQVVHAYRSVNIALLLNTFHGNYENPNIWEVEGEIVASDFGKVGCFYQKAIKRVKKPAWFTNKPKRGKVQVVFAIMCAEAVLSYFENKHPDDDRPRKAIEAAKKYLSLVTEKKYVAAYAADAADAARAAAYAAAYDASAAADAAAYAARAAAYAAAAAAAYAARAAAYAAAAAADAAADIDFVCIADKSVKIIESGKQKVGEVLP